MASTLRAILRIFRTMQLPPLVPASESDALVAELTANIKDWKAPEPQPPEFDARGLLASTADHILTDSDMTEEGRESVRDMGAGKCCEDELTRILVLDILIKWPGFFLFTELRTLSRLTYGYYISNTSVKNQKMIHAFAEYPDGDGALFQRVLVDVNSDSVVAGYHHSLRRLSEFIST